MSATENALSWGKRLLGVAAFVGTIAGIAVWLQRSSVTTEGPLPIAWGEEACAHCRMHLSDPRYAAQLVTPDGRAVNFDDPGCLLRYVHDTHPQSAAIYFHHGSTERWLRAPAVAFSSGATTPMGYGLAATDPGTPGALSLAQAEQAVLARSQPHAMEAAP